MTTGQQNEPARPASHVGKDEIAGGGTVLKLMVSVSGPDDDKDERSQNVPVSGRHAPTAFVLARTACTR